MNEQLRFIVADTLGIDPEAVTPETSRDSEPGWDSLNHLRLITAVEEAFGVKLTMAEIQAITRAAELEARIGAAAR
ncbi:MAG TPA: acyl carrier protein [Woeseiaceae bacterium]|nr:acyl carrier protein [Woeseiaceae bacterium]